jgi:hypothetical protein
MQNDISTNPDALLRSSRLSLWGALVIVTLIGGLMFALLLGGRSVVNATRVGLGLLPIFIVVVTAALSTALKVRNAATRAALRALLNDELRQLALSRAYRNAFAATLTVGAACMPILSVFEVQYAAAALYVLIATTGIVTLLGSVLYYDR